MAGRPIIPVDFITFTYTALTHTKASELYSGSLSALTSGGFTIVKTGGNYIEQFNSKSFSITIPMVSGSSEAGEDLTAMRAFVTNVSGSILPELLTEIANAGADPAVIEEIISHSAG